MINALLEGTLPESVSSLDTRSFINTLKSRGAFDVKKSDRERELTERMEAMSPVVRLLDESRLSNVDEATRKKLRDMALRFEELEYDDEFDDTYAERTFMKEDSHPSLLRRVSNENNEDEDSSDENTRVERNCFSISSSILTTTSLYYHQY